MDKIAMLKEILAQNPDDAFARYGLAMEHAIRATPPLLSVNSSSSPLRILTTPRATRWPRNCSSRQDATAKHASGSKPE